MSGTMSAQSAADSDELTGEDVLERRLDVAGVQCRGLNERKALLGREGLGLVGRDSTEVLKIGLVADEHDHNVLVRVVAQLLEPAGHVLVGRVLGNVVHEESTDGAAVVGRGDCAVALLASWRRLAGIRMG